MKTFLLLSWVMWVLLPNTLHAFYSFSQWKADELRTHQGIKIKAFESEGQVRFLVALQKLEYPEAYWHGSLHLVDESGATVASITLGGEDIRRAVDVETARKWGWEEFRGGDAEVFEFTADTRLVSKSRFSWEPGPRNDERGINYGGGVVTWCLLRDLLEATKDADKVGGANEKQPAH